MARQREPDLRLLCERCGYHLKGLRRSDACPECGKPVVESLPERRVGSAWQQEPDPVGLFKAFFRLVARPRAFWDHVSTQPAWNGMLLVTACIVAPAVPAIPIALLDLITSHPKFGPVVEIGEIAMVALALSVGFLLMSWIEAIGMRIVSRRREWRINREIASIIVAHSAVLWIFASGLVFLGAVIAMCLPADRDFRLAGMGVGLLAGIVLFETLVYIGMRKMKYANAPASERELAPEYPSPVGADADILSPEGRGSGESSPDPSSAGPPAK